MWDAGQAAWNIRMLSTTPPGPKVLGSTHSDLAPYLRACGPAPCVPLNSKRGLRSPATLIFQGVIVDPASAGERRLSVTTGVLLDVR